MIFHDLKNRSKADFEMIRKLKYKPVSVDLSKYQQTDLFDIRDRISDVYGCRATTTYTIKIILLNEMH